MQFGNFCSNNKVNNNNIVICCMGLLYASLCSEYLASVLAQKSASLYLGDIIIIDLSVLRPTLSTGSWTVLYGCLSDPDRVGDTSVF